MPKRKLRAESSFGTVPFIVGSGKRGNALGFKAAQGALLATMVQAAVDYLMRGDMRTKAAQDMCIWIVPHDTGNLQVSVE